MSSPFTEEEYAQAIPKNCKLTTIQAHEDILMCWGLISSITNNKEMNCGWCEFNNEHTEEEWLEQLRKERTWDILRK